MAKTVKKWENSDKSLFFSLFDHFQPKPPIPYFHPRINRAFSPKSAVLSKTRIPAFPPKTPLFASNGTKNHRGLKNSLGPGGVRGDSPRLTKSTLPSPEGWGVVDFRNQECLSSPSSNIYFTSAFDFCKQKSKARCAPGAFAPSQPRGLEWAARHLRLCIYKYIIYIYI